MCIEASESIISMDFSKEGKQVVINDEKED
jgi:hypothetical protein